MKLWNEWLQAVHFLRPAYRRSPTFILMVLALVRLCCRSDNAGIICSRAPRETPWPVSDTSLTQAEWRHNWGGELSTVQTTRSRIFKMIAIKRRDYQHALNRLLFAFLAFGILLLAIPHAFAQASKESISIMANKYQWEKGWSDSDCTSYSSEVGGKEFIAAKVVCEMAARFEVVATILRDINNYSDWMADCEATKILKVVDDEKDSLVFWLHQRIPFLKDRDMVVRTSVTTDYALGIHVIEVFSTTDLHFDSGKNLYRMPSFYARYTLSVIDREHTRVEFLIDPDLGKGIPVGIANASIKKIPFRSIVNMRKIAAEMKYVERAKLSKYAKEIEATFSQKQRN
jgi:hypothetical protein